MNLHHNAQRTDVWSVGQMSAHTVTGDINMLEAEMPAGGWPRGMLTEILAVQQDLGAIRLLMQALSRLSRDEGRWICWVAPPWVLDVAALSGSGIDLSRVLLVYPKAQQDGLWVVEESLRSGTCSAVLAWPMIDDSAILRRLQLAAKTGDTLGFLFRQVQRLI